MKKYIHTIYNKVGIKSDRTKNITKHVLLSIIYKGGTVIANFLLVPLTISYLNTENYGIWLTLSSFIAWFSFFDIGLDHGLRNKFTEAKAKGDLILARGYVSTAYFTIGSVCFVLMMIFFLINFFIDWTKVFNSDKNLKDDLNILMPIVFVFFCLRLVAKLITTIYSADQKHSIQGKVGFLIQVISLLLIWVITLTDHSSLIMFGIIYSSLPVFILIVFNFIAFKKSYKDYKPTLTLWKKKYLKDIFGLGFSFFIVQIAWITITSTDNLIISQLFTPKDVVPFNIALKLFSILIMGFSIIASPYWSSFADAYIKKDLEWIKISMKNLNKFVFIFFALGIIILLLSKYLYILWVGKDIYVPFEISLLICIYTCLIIYLTPYNYFLNGIGKIRIQLYQSVFMAILNIPISIFLAKYFNFGINGVVLGSLLCVIPGTIFSKIQYQKVINNKANGIWNK